MEFVDGRAESAPEINAVMSYVKEIEWEETINDEDQATKKITFNRTVKYRAIPHENKGRPCGRRLGAARWQINDNGHGLNSHTERDIGRHGLAAGSLSREAGREDGIQPKIQANRYLEA